MAVDTQPAYTGYSASNLRQLPRAESFDASILSDWRLQGRDLLKARRVEFDQLVSEAERLIAEGSYPRATAALQVAANHAVLWHSGQFSNDRIEQAIRLIGAAAVPNDTPPQALRPSSQPQKILHIATELYGIGGHARMLAHWIKSDVQNVHSLALTRQHQPIPSDVETAVAGAKGSISQINTHPGGLLQWAQILQQPITEADLIVLHIHNMDVIPLIALAGLKKRSPSLLVNHGDHQFWLGSTIVDLVVSTRRSGLQLCLDRRGVAFERNAMIPLCLYPKPRQQSRSKAKQILQIPAASVVILTIARSVKFRDIGGPHFIEAMLPLLQANPLLHMVIVGPQDQANWQNSIDHVANQVHVVAETTDTQTYLDAADIYLDSFPFVSITSLLEAGLHGLPLVTRSAFGPDCAVMAADSPGLDGVMIQTHSLPELRAEISRLVQDAPWRENLGSATQARIMSQNLGVAWREQLDDLYKTARALGQNPGILAPQHGESDLDRFIPFVFDDRARETTGSYFVRIAWATELVLKAAPLTWRIAKLLQITRAGELRGHPFRALLSEWIGVRLKQWYRQYSRRR